MENDQTLDAEECLMMASFYDLLAHFWLAEVTPEQLEVLNTPELKAALEELGASIPPAHSAEVVEQLAVDYCQLFIGPTGQLVPVQSVWESGQLQAEISDSCREFYKMLPEFEPQNPLPDHLGNQLDFMACLFGRMAEAQDLEAASQLGAMFLEDHLDWVEPLTHAVQEKAETDFYRGVGRLTAEFLHEFDEHD